MGNSVAVFPGGVCRGWQISKEMPGVRARLFLGKGMPGMDMRSAQGKFIDMGSHDSICFRAIKSETNPEPLATSP